MINWFMKRGRRRVMLLGVPAAVLAFILLNMAGSTQSSEQAGNSDGGIGKAYEEVFSAVNPADPADVYIQWDLPKSTPIEGQYDSAYTNWFLGAYKSVAGHWSDGVSANETLCVALDSTMLPTANLEYTIHYFDAENSFLFLNLLDANGLIIAENLYGNFLAGSGADRVISLNLPLADFPDAAVIQLRLGAGEASALNEVAVYESRIYIEGDESRLNAAQEFYNSESEHTKGANDSDAVSRIYPDAEQRVTSRDNLREEEQFNPARDNVALTSISKAGIIFVDQMIGDDQFTGRSYIISGQDGPKRTIRSGLTVADEADTLIIKSGTYNENLDIKDKNIKKVVIEGNVRL